MLVCGERLDIARSQVHPLLDWVPDQRVGWLLRENAHRPALWRKTQPQVAFLQSYWDTPFVEMETLIALIREESPRTKICYLDWFAPANVPETTVVEVDRRLEFCHRSKVSRSIAIRRDGQHRPAD